MVPPPKPPTRDDTVVSDTANGPRDASMLATVGAGPRSYGLAAAWAVAWEVPVASTSDSARGSRVRSCTALYTSIRQGNRGTFRPCSGGARVRIGATTGLGGELRREN